ncbi:MAG: hypothetical protein WAM97_01695, partial [Acidimicrobiales bacterium]
MIEADSEFRSTDDICETVRAEALADFFERGAVAVRWTIREYLPVLREWVPPNEARHRWKVEQLVALPYAVDNALNGDLVATATLIDLQERVCSKDSPFRKAISKLGSVPARQVGLADVTLEELEDLSPEGFVLFLLRIPR